MNGTQLYLWLGQAAVMGSVFALSLSLSLVAVLSEVGRVRRGALVAMVVIGALSLPASVTRMPTEDIVRSVSGVTLASVENQQQIARFALIVNEALGTIALTGLLVRRRERHVAPVVRRVKGARNRGPRRPIGRPQVFCFLRDVNWCSQNQVRP